MSGELLKLTDVRVTYGPIPAVQGVSLDVPRGKVVALIGANGAGKSTLLRAVSGILRISGGHVVCSGTDITNWAPHRIARLGITHVPEGRRVVAPLTVEENLLLAGSAVGRDTASGLSRVYALFPRLAERRLQNSASLSGGEQQMLALGRAMMTEPHYVLLDEPSMGLAPIVINQVYEIIHAAAKHFSGAGILLAEQSAALALDVATYVYVLAQGRVALQGDTAEVKNNELLDAYLGRREAV